MRGSLAVSALVMCFVVSKSAFGAETTSTDFCLRHAEGDKYVSTDQLAYIRQLSTQQPAPAAFSDFPADDSAVAAEALRVGPSGGFFAARLLRDLAIIDALDAQAKCSSQSNCEKPPLISHFKDGSPGDANRDKSWHDLVVAWKKFRDDHARLGRACLEISKGLPTATTMEVALAAPAKSLDDPRNTVRAEPIETNNVQVVVSNASVPERSTEREDKGEKIARADGAASKEDCTSSVGKVLQTAHVLFEKNSYVISDKWQGNLEVAAYSLAACPAARIEIIGHTDPDGRPNYNTKLGEKRAASIAQALIQKGAKEAQVRTTSVGSARLLDADQGLSRKELKARNRTVEITAQ